MGPLFPLSRPLTDPFSLFLSQKCLYRCCQWT